LNETTESLQKGDIETIMKINKDLTSFTIWRNHLYISDANEIYSIDHNRNLKKFAEEPVSEIIKASELGRIVRGITVLSVWKDFLISAHETGDLILWDSSQEMVLKIDSEIPFISVIIWGERIVTRNRENKVQVWEINLEQRRGKCIYYDSLRVHQTIIWTNNLVTLTIRDEDGRPGRQIRVLDSDFNCTKIFAVPGASVKYISSWKNKLACACTDGSIRLLDENATLQSKIETSMSHAPSSLATWNGNLIFFTSLHQFSLSTAGWLEMWNVNGICEKKIKIERPSVQIKSWRDKLVVRTINGIIIYKDNRFCNI